MENRAECRYSTYGIALAGDGVTYIDWSENPPGERRDDIFGEIERLPDRTLSNLVALKEDSARAEIFELETVSRRDEAIQAVEFWRNLWRFLGLNLVEGQGERSRRTLTI